MIKTENSKLIKRVTFNDYVQMVYNQKLKKIRCSKDRDKIISLEYLYIDYYTKKIPIDDLFEPNACKSEDETNKPEIIKELIQILSYVFYNPKKYSTRISKDDFISVAYEKAWQTIINYSYKDKYFLYQRLKLNTRNACIDLLRNEGLTKDRNSHTNTEFHRATILNSYSEEKDAFDLENSIILRISLEQAVKTLDEEEMKVYNLFLNSDNIEKLTLDDICLSTGLKYRQQAKRIVGRIQSKLLQFCEH
ncbi:sigma-70 RNA polymerase sigma factor region 4 domain-containing protein [Priestia abyssalis]|uniref:sigma-70 family RNA polymerase sigma factor n=1 Tax=Priestia abyssalis TaxID=1221450 RepID=UPI000994D888|nr:sigma-70 family RNA polymerase sigma factor [Priestia abyssalis]